MTDQVKELAKAMAQELNGGMFDSPEFYNGSQRELWEAHAARILSAIHPEAPNARAEALREAAEVCMTERKDWIADPKAEGYEEAICRDNAEAILALIDQPSPSTETTPDTPTVHDTSCRKHDGRWNT